MSKYFISHPEKGVFLGIGDQGSALWSKTNSQGRNTVFLFTSENHYEFFMDTLNIPITNNEVHVIENSERYATMADVVAIGMEPW